MLRTGLLLISLCILSQSGFTQCLAGNCQHGYSKFRFQNGAVYEGHMSYGKLNGDGTLKYRNGDIYKGKWKLNKRDGQGILTTTRSFRYQRVFDYIQLYGDVIV